jgi:hypothetical protein
LSFFSDSLPCATSENHRHRGEFRNEWTKIPLLPRVEVTRVVSLMNCGRIVSAINPIAARGMGEIGITGMATALANAVYHATGKRIRDLPITPDKLI